MGFGHPSEPCPKCSRLVDYSEQSYCSNCGHKLGAPIKTTPTKEGKKRYPPDGFYEEFVCTCTKKCPTACKGQCKCEACSAAYNDQLDVW